MILGFPFFLVIVAFVSVIFIHELGHYLVGRLCGIGASTFSIGFGPKLFSFKDSNNTEWKLCLIPLGGFVKFVTNEDDGSSSLELDGKNSARTLPLLNQRSFDSSSLFARTLTVLAGPFANFLMSAIIFTYVAVVSGTMSLSLIHI